MSSPAPTASAPRVVFHYGGYPIDLQDYLDLFDDVFTSDFPPCSSHETVRRLYFLREVLEMLQRSTVDATSPTEVFKNILTSLGVPLVPSEGEEASVKPTRRFGSSFGLRARDPLEEPTQLEAYEYRPHPHDSNGRARSPSPPPPAPPTLYPTDKRVDFPDDTKHWYTIERAYSKSIEIEEARYEALRSGELCPVIDPPTSREQDYNDPFLIVDTLEGKWGLLSNHGYEYRANYDAWISEVNERRLRDGIEDLIPVREGYKVIVNDEVMAQFEAIQRRMRKNNKKATKLAKSQGRAHAKKEAARARALKKGTGAEKFAVAPTLKRIREEDEEEEDIESSPKKARITKAMPARSPSAGRPSSPSSKLSSKVSRRSLSPDSASTTPPPTTATSHLVGSTKTCDPVVSATATIKPTPDSTATAKSHSRRSPRLAKNLTL
ncbi:hypothetical protein HYPSUDRAFT_52593 [Hypholoma sublateritium FD-334 SS-4]|uniref:Uncharacterized protein n=1 Tax=Hypholoma sublateritium (strain FD-334 SS-4) TaxID=945553 RepID=A0A0D2LFB0_HYPSF|nr:hypothetical protein HYPSUDRAFT_52593 [Hypholoma sublateritium FD-334 SS-4]